MEYINKKLGKQLRKIREMQDLTRKDVSKLAFTSHNTIVRQEQGISPITVEDLINYCKIYKVSISDVLNQL